MAFKTITNHDIKVVVSFYLCTSLVPRPTFSNDDHRTAGLGRKSIEVVLSAGMSPGPIKIESLRDVTLIARMFKPHLRLSIDCIILSMD